MNYKNIFFSSIIALAPLFIIGCDSQENMGSNRLRAQAYEIERQEEKPGRELETAYGSAISESFKKLKNKIKLWFKQNYIQIVTMKLVSEPENQQLHGEMIFVLNC